MSSRGMRILKLPPKVFQRFIVDSFSVPDAWQQFIRNVGCLEEGVILEAVEVVGSLADDDVQLYFSHPSWPEVEHCSQWPFIDVKHGIEIVPEGVS